MRGVVGSMDFTPTWFSRPELTNSLAHELALPVVYESGWTHLGDHPEGFRAHPEAERYLELLPTVSDDTRLVAGGPEQNADVANAGTWVGSSPDRAARCAQHCRSSTPATGPPTSSPTIRTAAYERPAVRSNRRTSSSSTRQKTAASRRSSAQHRVTRRLLACFDVTGEELGLGRALQLVGWPLGGRTEQLPSNWHGDRRWRVDDPYGRAASLRAIRLGRGTIYEDDQPLTEVVVGKQTHVGRTFTMSGVPFMRLLTGPIRHGDEIVVLYEWLAGAPADRPTANMAHTVGRTLRRLHEIGHQIPADDLPRHDTVELTRRVLAELDGVAPARFLDRAAGLLDEAVARPVTPIVCHGDLGMTNLLWTDSGTLSGLVDLDKIGAGDPVQELARVVKQWSRPGGTIDHTYDRELSDAVLAGYGADAELRAVLRPLLWFAGCLNLNTVRKIQVAAADSGELERTVAHYEGRADRLAALVD